MAEWIKVTFFSSNNLRNYKKNFACYGGWLMLIALNPILGCCRSCAEDLSDEGTWLFFKCWITIIMLNNNELDQADSNELLDIKKIMLLQVLYKAVNELTHLALFRLGRRVLLSPASIPPRICGFRQLEPGSPWSLDLRYPWFSVCWIFCSLCYNQ